MGGEKYDECSKLKKFYEKQKDVTEAVKSQLNDKRNEAMRIVKDELETISLIDPTGVADAADAFMFPLCSEIEKDMHEVPNVDEFSDC